MSSLVINYELLDEDHCLHKSPKMLPNETISILYHVCSVDWWNTQTINIHRLKLNHNKVPLSVCPRGMEIVP